MRPSDFRLALCSDTWEPQVNGVTRTLARVVDAVERRGGEVRVFTAADPGAARNRSQTRYPSAPFPLYGQLRLAAPTSGQMRRELLAFQPSVVHVATPFGVGLAARAAARRLSIPLVTSYHTSFCAYAEHYHLGWLKAQGWRYLRWFHNAGRRTLCPTTSVCDDLGARGFQHLARWGRGVDCETFSPQKRSRVTRIRLGANDSTIIVAYVGRMAKEKGIDDLLAAARCARRARSRIVFAFAGDGPYLDTCMRQAPANCVFTGGLAGAELSEFYASADVFAFPSTTDTFGNVLLEAMASGLPILAADTRTNREVVEAGAFYHPRSIDHLTAHLDAMIGAEGRLRQLAISSRLRAGQFSWQKVVDELMTTYAAVIQESHGADRAMRLDRRHLQLQY